MFQPCSLELYGCTSLSTLSLKVAAVLFDSITLCRCINVLRLNTLASQPTNNQFSSAWHTNCVLLVLLLVPRLLLQTIQHSRASEHFLAVPSSAAGRLQTPAKPHATGSCVQDT